MAGPGQDFPLLAGGSVTRSVIGTTATNEPAALVTDQQVIGLSAALLRSVPLGVRSELWAIWTVNRYVTYLDCLASRSPDAAPGDLASEACRGLAHPMQALGPDVTNSMVHICSACRPRLSASAKWALGQSWGQPRLGIVNSLLLGPGHPLSRYEGPGTGRGRSEVSVVALRLGPASRALQGKTCGIAIPIMPRSRKLHAAGAAGEDETAPTLPERPRSPVVGAHCTDTRSQSYDRPPHPQRSSPTALMSSSQH